MPKISEVWFGTQDLEPILQFYRDLLGFEIVSKENKKAQFQVGTTKLGFFLAEKTEEFHFAFNVADLDEASSWLSQRVKQIEAKGESRFHFENWNASAIYFQDPAGNLLELIQREETTETIPGHVQSLSEVGIVLSNFEKESKEIKEQTGLDVYKDTESENFMALGDAEGLLVLVQEGRTWYPTDNLKAKPARCEIKMAGIRGSWESEDRLIKISPANE